MDKYCYVDKNDNKIAFEFDNDIENILENVYGKTLKNNDEITLDVEGNEMSLSHTVSRSTAVVVPGGDESGNETIVKPVVPETGGDESSGENIDEPIIGVSSNLSVTIDDVTVNVIKNGDQYLSTQLYNGVMKEFASITEIIDFIKEEYAVNENSTLLIIEGRETKFDGYLRDYVEVSAEDILNVNVTYRGDKISGFTYNKITGKYYYYDEEFDINDIVDVFMFKGGYYDAGNATLIYSLEETGLYGEIELTMETGYTIKYRKDGEWKNVFYFDYDEENDKFIFVNHDNEEYSIDELREYLEADEGYAIIVMENEYTLVKSYPGKWKPATLSYYDLEGNEIGPLECEKIGEMIRENEDSEEYWNEKQLAYLQYIFGEQRDLLKSVTIDGYVYGITCAEMYLEYTTYKDTTDTLVVYEWMQNYSPRYLIVDDNQTIVDNNIENVVKYYLNKYSNIITVNTDVFSLYYKNGTLCDTFTVTDSGWVYCELYKLENKRYGKFIFNENDGLKYKTGEIYYDEYFCVKDGYGQNKISIKELANEYKYYELYDLSGNLIKRQFKHEGQYYVFGYQNTSDDAITFSNPYVIISISGDTVQYAYFALDENATGTIYNTVKFKKYLEEQCGETLDYLRIIYNDMTYSITFDS